MNKELKPCPWCKSIHVQSFPAHAASYAPSVLCHTCGRAVDAEDAEVAWNDLPRTVQAAPSVLGDWRIDTYSTGNPILTYQHCSVIQDDQAFEVMALLQRRAASSDQERRMEIALQFYADPNTYHPAPRADRLGPPSPLVMQDRGDKARAALADTNNDGENNADISSI